MLEAGTVSSNNIQNILFKNFLDMCIGAIMFFLCGYALAFGSSLGGFLGITHFALVDFDVKDFSMFFSVCFCFCRRHYCVWGCCRSVQA